MHLKEETYMSEENLEDYMPSDLDWTHINETILMIGLAVAQIEKALTDGDDSISVLTESFISMMTSISSIMKDVEVMPDTKIMHTVITESKSEINMLLKNSSPEQKASLTKISDLINTINDINDEDAKSRIQASIDKASRLIQDTIVAFQFYDRLSQRLHQIVSSLGMMSQLIADRQRLHNPYEWAELQDSIKSRYTIDADRIMFDALLAGASIEESIEIAGDYESENEQPDDAIELF